MKISDILLATMLVSAFGSHAQDSTKIEKSEIRPISVDTILTDSTRTSEISSIQKHIDSLYSNRHTIDSLQETQQHAVKPNPRPYFSCPACGRG